MSKPEDELSPWEKREQGESPLGQFEKLLSPDGPVFSQMAPEMYRQRIWQTALELIRAGVPRKDIIKEVLALNIEIEAEVAKKFPVK